ncbi:hypothetical protein HZ326_5492 [Fusarium oxysporum f. sp. albedinis]|nr:hypothetical protein HZ326_5492 [Fusarium oxysporum f. sp. albedinis]
MTNIYSSLCLLGDRLNSDSICIIFRSHKTLSCLTDQILVLNTYSTHSLSNFQISSISSRHVNHIQSVLYQHLKQPTLYLNCVLE